MSVAFSPDGKSLAVGYGGYSGNQVGRVKVWDVASGKEIKAFTGPRGGVNKVAFHPDGKRLAVAGSEVVEVWDLETGAQASRPQGAHEMGLLPRLQPRREMAGHRRVGPHRQAPGRRDGRRGADDLRARRVRPEPRVQPRQPQPRHGERGPERQALGGPFRPAVGDVSRPYRLRPGGRLPARWPRDRHGEHGWVDPVLGPQDEPSRRGRTHRLGGADSPSGATDFGSSRRRDGSGPTPCPRRAGTLSPANSTPRWPGSNSNSCPPNSCRAPGITLQAVQRHEPRRQADRPSRVTLAGYGGGLAEQGILRQLGDHPRMRRPARSSTP